MFDEMHVEAILNPEKAEDAVDGVAARLRERAKEARSAAAIFGDADDLRPGEAQRLLAHPLPHWLERMTVNYLLAHGGRAERGSRGWNLTWPDGGIHENAVFSGKEAERFPASRRLTMEEPRIRALIQRLPRFAPGQPIPAVEIPGLAGEVRGLWSLWLIEIAGMEWGRRRIMPLFLADKGGVYAPAAGHVWDRLLTADVRMRPALDGSASEAAFAKLRQAAEERGQDIHAALELERQEHIKRERDKADHAFATRRRIIGRLGLPQVRSRRLDLLLREERSAQAELDRKSRAYPEMAPLLAIRVEGGGDG
jgi:hypothetical protein